MLVSLHLSASTHIVTVSDFQFTPSNLNVVVGDVIRWEWESGYHNAASLSVPVGATPWISSYLYGAGDYYEYTVTKAGAYDYYCDIHGTAMSGSFTASGAVPVNLSAFNVNNKNSKPTLSWTTQSESNSQYFSIRRSYDGFIYTEIAKVPAAGNSSVLKNYSFIDLHVKANTKYVYYELGITDKDEKVQLSPIKLLKNNDANKKLITSISPNPVSEAGHLILQFNADAKGTMLARIVNMSGKTVLVANLSASMGVNNGHIHIADLAPGNYIIQFTLDTIVETYKIQKK